MSEPRFLAIAQAPHLHAHPFPVWGWGVVALVLCFVAWGVCYIADAPVRQIRRAHRAQTWTEDQL